MFCNKIAKLHQNLQLELHDFYCQITFQETIFWGIETTQVPLSTFDGKILNPKAAQLIWYS